MFVSFIALSSGDGVVLFCVFVVASSEDGMLVLDLLASSEDVCDFGIFMLLFGMDCVARLRLFVAGMLFDDVFGMEVDRSKPALMDH